RRKERIEVVNRGQVGSAKEVVSAAGISVGRRTVSTAGNSLLEGLFRAAHVQCVGHEVVQLGNSGNDRGQCGRHAGIVNVPDMRFAVDHKVVQGSPKGSPDVSGIARKL